MVDVHVSGKRKTASAKALIRAGAGRVYINDIPIETHPVEKVKQRVLEAVNVIPEAVRRKVDIFVKVQGGGYSGQADAARIAVGRAFVKFTGSEKIRRQLLEYDRTILAGDSRSKESKKFGGPGARRRFQKSYR